MNPDWNFMSSTYYRFNPETKIVESMVTVMPDGLSVAWWLCRICKQDVKYCKCARGVSVCRSIEWIYDKTVAHMAGQEWDINHLNYSGSLTRAYRERNLPRVPDWERGRNVTTAEERAAARAAQGPRPLKPAGGGSKALSPTKGVLKPTQRPARKGLAPKVDLEKLDLADLGDAAADEAADLTAQVRKALTPAKRPVKKAAAKKTAKGLTPRKKR